MLPTNEKDIPHLSILSKKWKYRGEGNANLVLALLEERVILRLHKTHRDTPVTQDVEYEEVTRAVREAFFCRTVMVPLLGHAYIQPPTAARVQHKEIHQLDQQLLPQRPKFRHHKGISVGVVNIYPDYALLPEHLMNGNTDTADPTFCVEIKPKQGWIPHSQQHHSKCTFCLNQYLKLYNGAISKISQYCPLDLFSGDEKRTKKAIKSLLRTPQNNLKIFKDGNLVYSGEGSQDLTGILQQWLEPSKTGSTALYPRLIESFCSLVHHALKTDLLGEVDYPAINSPDTDICPFICPPRRSASVQDGWWDNLQPCDPSSFPLHKNSILDRIISIQKLQQCDTDTIHHMLWRYKGCDDYAYVSKLRDPETNQLCLDPIQRYLLATTAKDCSILITFHRNRNSNSVPPKHLVVDSVTGNEYVFNIGVSDLDPKPLSCVEKHRVRDADILYACASSCSLSPPSPPPN